MLNYLLSQGPQLQQSSTALALTGVGYDPNGNITALSRTDGLGKAMDQLAYANRGNQLQSVGDAAPGQAGLEGFRDRSQGAQEYAYDANGSMVRDDNKGISHIGYNHLSLPTRVDIANEAGTGRIDYAYDASGAKLSKRVTAGGQETVTEYAGAVVYRDGALDYVNLAGGYLEPDAPCVRRGTAERNARLHYVYRYSDHDCVQRAHRAKRNAQSSRLVFSDSDGNLAIDRELEIRRERNYYPFGLQQKGYNSTVIGTENNYQTYVGKEINESLGYNMLEMDWRHYDPAIGRFVGVDVFAESYEGLTPYHYGENSPIMYSDPTGLFTDVVNEETGEVYHIDDGYDFRFVVSSDDFAEISKSGAIPDRLNRAWNSEFWRQVWEGVVTSDGSASDEITGLLVTDNLKDVTEVAVQLSDGKYGAAAIGLAMIPVNKLKKLKKLKKWLKKNDGKKIPGTKKGNVTFGNRQGKLPKTDADGNPITNKEYDITPAPAAGRNRGAERIVRGSDGKTYYTDDHYKTFTEIKD